MIIRKATIIDSNEIVNFQLLMAKETENINLDKKIVEKGVKSVFENHSKGVYYIAEQEKKVIASLLTTYEWSDWRNSTILWIQSVYVLPEYRGQKVFSRMYDHLKNIVTTSIEYYGLRLYVDITNTIAQKVYTSKGMDGGHYKVFEWMKE